MAGVCTVRKTAKRSGGVGARFYQRISSIFSQWRIPPVYLGLSSVARVDFIESRFNVRWRDIRSRLFLMIESVRLDRARDSPKNHRAIYPPDKSSDFLRANERNPIKNNNERYVVVIL
jgi:hypothetical protein